MKTSVPRAKLIALLTSNRDEHHAIYLEAVEGYRKKAQELLDEQIARLQATPNRNVRIYVSLTQPVDYTHEYDLVLGLLEMSEDKNVALDDDDFRKYVQDEWEWSRTFSASNSAYTSRAQGHTDDD